MKLFTKDVCLWVYDNDYDYYDTGCNKTFILKAGTPKQNGIKFCPHCGKLLVVEDYEQTA